MRCISCKKPTRNATQTTNKCDECDIIYFGDMNYDGNDCGRYIENYVIQWNRDEYSADPITAILKDKWFESIKQWYPDEIKVIDGWKLFDIKTKEQLEKLLILI
jgi:hypothetical protein